jgi:hypothetical protein
MLNGTQAVEVRICDAEGAPRVCVAFGLGLNSLESADQAPHGINLSGYGVGDIELCW